MPIRLRAIAAIIFTNLLIILFSVFAGIYFIRSNIERSQETDINSISDIADHFISAEIDLLKLKASIIAENMAVVEESDIGSALIRQLINYPDFIGISIIDMEQNIIASVGNHPAAGHMINDPYLNMAFNGTIAFSSTYPSDAGMLLYLAAPFPENMVLVLTLPGMHFSQRVSTIVIWESGHIFMTDSEGIIIANLRESWVQSRLNFFRLAEEDSQYLEVAAVLRRVVNGETGTGYFSIDGVPRLCSFRPVRASIEGWSMGIIAPLPESPFRDIDNGLIIVGLVAFVLSIVVAVIASGPVKKPYEQIAALKEEAESSSMYKSSFLAKMSHEMRTPMNAIIGMTSIGRNSDDTEKKDYAFENIENASTHLLGVINDVLDMSKIEANKLELSNVSFNLEKLLARVVNVISFNIHERKQEFSIHFDRDIPPFIVADDQRLAQVITNLLSNAAKFTPPGGSIKVNIKYLGEEKDGSITIQVDVSDTGIGISEEQQKHLFSSFEQAEKGTSRKFGGTGLGLFISRRIVELMGGSIWIDSEIGKGSTFSFTIKTERGEGINESMLAPDVNIENIKILIIDDNQEVLDYFCDILNHNRIKCDVALNGKEAFDLINKNGLYDIYFIDWQMPEMDGLEISGRIKDMSSDNPENRPVVIMISGYHWDSIKDNAKEAGIDIFIPKPLFPSSIIDAINKCLGSNNIKYVKEKSQNKEADNFKNFTLLLVEDVEINREIVLTFLEPTNLSIECAVNGLEAVEKFKSSPGKFDLILMDIQMPEMDGYEATTEIRAIEKADNTNLNLSSEIPIIAMTANVFREDIEKCISVGMNDHLGKPLDIDEVMRKLKKYLLKEADE